MSKKTQKTKGNLLYFNVPGLTRFILKVEMERVLYEETFKMLLEKAKDVRDKYSCALKIEEFLQKISSLRDKEKIKQSYLEFAEQSINERLKFGDIFEIDVDNITGSSIPYCVNANKINVEYIHPDIGMEKYYQVSNALKTTGEKVIVNSVQFFEEYFESLLRRLILKKPGAYLHDKTITFDELFDADLSIIKERLINKEINKLMYNLRETLAKVEKIHKLNLSSYQYLVDGYYEISLVRNVLVHNNGVVNQEFLDELPNSMSGNYKNGSLIQCTKTYIEEKTNNLIKFAYLLFFLIGETDKDADELEKTAFDLLKKENWDVAEFTYELLLKMPKIGNGTKYDYLINKLNAKKHKFGLDNVRDEINELDVTGMTPTYLIAKDLLLENNDQVTIALESYYPDSFNSYAIQTWPIFIEYRKTEEYKTFIKNHEKDFEPYEFIPKTK